MVGAAARFPARLPAAGDFRSVQKQLLALTGPPRELRGGRVQAGEYREEGGGEYARDALPGWRRAPATAPPGVTRARPATATQKCTPTATRHRRRPRAPQGAPGASSFAACSPHSDWTRALQIRAMNDIGAGLAFGVAFGKTCEIQHRTLHTE